MTDPKPEGFIAVPPTHIVHEEEEDGDTLDYQARALFIQVINHGIEHRTNIPTILSSLGLPAPESALVAGLYYPTYRSIGHIGAVSTRRLVTFGDSDGGGKATRTDRAHVCAVAGSP